MRFRIKGNYRIDRQVIASMLAMIIEADNRWEPYMPNEGRDHHWTLDRGNDWFLQFYEDDSRMCEVQYRYTNPQFGPELFAYIAKRMGWDVVA